MRRTVVITDSTTCPTQRPSAIVTVHLMLHLRTGLWWDDDDARGPVWEALGRGDHIKISAPGALDYLDTIEDSRADEALIVTPAADLAVMHRNARFAAELADRPVAVVDSRTAAPAQRLVARAAQAAVDRGAPLQEAVRATEDAAARAELVAMVDATDRVGHSDHPELLAVDDAGGRARFHLFRLERGDVQPLGVARDRATASEQIVDHWRRRGGEGAHGLVFHAVAGTTGPLLERMPTTPELVRISPAMTAYVGRGAVGIAWLRP